MEKKSFKAIDRLEKELVGNNGNRAKEETERRIARENAGYLASLAIGLFGADGSLR